MNYSNIKSWRSSRRDFRTHTNNLNNLFTLDEVLLRTLLTIQSPSGEEDVMISFITTWIEENIPSAEIVKDTYNNIYVTKRTNTETTYFPCIVAHTDEVCADATERVVVKADNLLMGIDPTNGEWAGIGGDDKCGIYIALEMLRLLPDVKCFFPVSEEVGGIGSEYCNLSFFSDCGFVIQPDRFGNNSVVTDTNGLTVCTPEFINAFSNVMLEYNYVEDTTGTFTDIGVLAERGLDICVTNISCGYYDQHDYEEKVCMPDVENAMNFIYKICIELSNQRFDNYLLEEQLFTPYYKYQRQKSQDEYDDFYFTV